MRYAHNGLWRSFPQGGVFGWQHSHFYCPAEQMVGREQLACLCLSRLLAYDLKILFRKCRMQLIVGQKSNTFGKVGCQNLQGKGTSRTLPCRNVVQRLLEGQPVIMRGPVGEQGFSYIIHTILAFWLLQGGCLPDLPAYLNGMADMGRPDNKLNTIRQGTDVRLG